MYLDDMNTMTHIIRPVSYTHLRVMPALNSRLNSASSSNPKEAHN